MKNYFLAAVAGIVLSGTCHNVSATTIVPKVITCPIGGEEFAASMYGSLFLYGNRPDGRPLGTFRGWVPVPECPGNHLILYREFTPSEIERLKSIITSSEYAGMTGTESQFFRVAWLEKRLVPESKQYVWYLLHATWEVDNVPEKKARYRALFLAIAETVPVDADMLDTVVLRLRVANAYREMGQFDKSMQMLDALPLQLLAEGLPEKEDDVNKLSEDEQKRWFVVNQAKQLKVIIDRRDSNIDPIDVLPDWMAEEECYFRTPKTAFETAFCARPEMVARLADDKTGFEEERSTWDYDGPIGAPPPPPPPPPLAKTKRHKSH